MNNLVYWVNGWSIGILCGAISSNTDGPAPTMVIVLFLVLAVATLAMIFMNKYSFRITNKEK